MDDTQETVTVTLTAPRLRRERRQRRPIRRRRPCRRPSILRQSGLILVVLFTILTVIGLNMPSWTRVGDHVDTALLRGLAHLRVSWLSTAARAIKVAGSGWGVTFLGLGAVVALMIVRRWRHLIVYLLSLLTINFVGNIVVEATRRPRPFSVTTIAAWGGFSMPSPPVGILAAVLVGLAYAMVVPGRPRQYAKICIGALVLVLALARLYLAVDHLSDVIFGITLGVAIPVTLFRLITPNESFPVVYRRGRAAHLQITGNREAAIKRAIHEQLGLTVLEIKPFGLSGSGGSTPLRLTMSGDPPTYLFAKLYAKNHVRSDRWYKIWRTILYGRLEDEASFQTVRRFVEYEDYTLRLLWDAGIPTAEPYGIVEITPEREYMLVTQFFHGAVEISEAEVTDDTIDQGLGLIRKLWDVGVAHRDVKPANLMVLDGQLLLIDVFFVQVRPSPWRQAVDLANMMLVLAVHTDAERVYRRALNSFSPEELGEAFAATRGVASPTQLRQFLKRDGRDLLAKCRELAPARAPITLQRWSFRRVGTALVMLGAITLAVLAGVTLFFPVQNVSVDVAPECGTGRSMILAAQAVPSATRLPCIASLPAGWGFRSANIHSGVVTFSLDVGTTPVVTVSLTPTCSVAGAQEIPSDEPGTRRFEKPLGAVAGVLGDPHLPFPRRLHHLSVPAARRLPVRAGPGQRHRPVVPGPKHAGAVRAALGGPHSLRGGSAVPAVTGDPAGRRGEHALLGTPRRDTIVFAVLAVATAVWFVMMANHATRAPIDRFDHTFLRWMITIRSRPLTLVAEFFKRPGARVRDAAGANPRGGVSRLASAVVALGIVRLGRARLRGVHRADQGPVRTRPSARPHRLDERHVVPIRARGRGIGDDRRRGHRPAARGNGTLRVGGLRGGLLGHHGPVARLPGRSLAVGCDRRRPHRHLGRPRGGGRGALHQGSPRGSRRAGGIRGGGPRHDRRSKMTGSAGDGPARRFASGRRAAAGS